MPDEVMVYCQKCRAFVWHKVLPGDLAKCLGCGDERDLKDPGVVVVEEAKQGKQEKRI